MFRRSIALALAVALVCPLAVHAGDRVFVSGGGGEDGTMARVGLQRDWGARWFGDGDWYLGGLWEANVGRWWGKDRSDEKGGHNNLWEIGVTPVFRFQRHRPYSNGLSPYVEAGVGVHFLSQTRYSDKKLSTSFQFGDHIGAGVQFGPHGKYTLTYRYQHHSNGSIKSPNPGVDFHILQFAYEFR